MRVLVIGNQWTLRDASDPQTPPTPQSESHSVADSILWIQSFIETQKLVLHILIANCRASEELPINWKMSNSNRCIHPSHPTHLRRIASFVRHTVFVLMAPAKTVDKSQFCQTIWKKVSKTILYFQFENSCLFDEIEIIAAT